MTVLLLLIFLLIFLVIAFWVMPKPEHKFHPSALSIQAIITVFVAALAGYWYLIERKGTAHANIELSAAGVRLNESTVLIQARVEIENTGHILLEPVEWDVRLLSVVPQRGFPLEAASRHAIEHFDQWPAELNGARGYRDNELQWSALRHFTGPAEQQIEPGERDIRIFDMLVPCEIQTAKFTVSLRKPPPQWWQRSEIEGGWWWKERMLLNVRRLCEGDVGVVLTLEPAENEGEADEGG